MAAMEHELRGGSMGRVTRSGGTVRRTAGPWTPTVHDLLRHVRSRGITWAPEPHGLDEQGREVVGFIEGDVPAYPLPAWVWEDSVLVEAARRLRAYHDATIGFPRAGRRWQLPPHEPDEVVCHNDFAPYNLVFDGGRLVGAIDFDTASPGPRIWDLAYLAYRLVPLTAPGNPDAVPRGEATSAARLERLCAAYGGDVDPDAVIATAARRVDELAAFTAARADAGEGDVDALRSHVAIYTADVAHLRARAAARRPLP